MNNQNWWCPACKCEVAPEDVTFEELHDRRKGGCDEPVLSEKPKEPLVVFLCIDKHGMVCDTSFTEQFLNKTDGCTIVKFKEVIE